MDRGRDACDVADPDGARERGGNRLERADRSRSCSFGPELSQDFTERDSKATKLNASVKIVRKRPVPIKAIMSGVPQTKALI